MAENERKRRRYKLYNNKNSTSSIPRSTFFDRKKRDVEEMEVEVSSDSAHTFPSLNAVHTATNANAVPIAIIPNVDACDSSGTNRKTSYEAVQDLSDNIDGSLTYSLANFFIDDGGRDGFPTDSEDNSDSGDDYPPPPPDPDPGDEDPPPLPDQDDDGNPPDQDPLPGPLGGNGNPPPNGPPPDYYGLDQLVIPNVTLTKFEILVTIFHYSVRFGLSDVAVKALIAQLNLILGVEIIPASNYIFNKIFFSTYTKNIHLYCPKCLLYLGKKEDCEEIQVCPADDCFTPVDAKSSNNGNFFISISIADQIKEKLLNGHGDNLISYRQRRIADDRDVFDCINFQTLERKVADQSDSFLTLTMETDGAPVFENSRNSVWPNQFYINEVDPKERFAPYNVLLSAVWFGRSEPSMSTYLTPTIEELQRLASEGITWYRETVGREEVTKVYCLNVSLDTIAKPKVMKMIQFNGFDGCYLCTHPGDPYENSLRYGYHENQFPLRTEASMRQAM